MYRVLLAFLFACPTLCYPSCKCSSTTSDNPPECAGVDCSACMYRDRLCPTVSKVVNGVYMTRMNCCCTVGSWVSYSFADTPDAFKTFDGVSYLKNGDAISVFVPSHVPDMVDYPGHPSSLYNSSSCRNRCCSASPCDPPGDCVAWSPCSVNSRWDATMQGVVVLVVLSVVGLPFVAVYVSVPCALALVQIVVFAITLIPVSDFDHWYSSTGVSMEYVSYQACMRFCDTKSDDVRTIRYKFCGDASHAKYPWSYDSVNPYLPKDSAQCPSDLYCSSCYDHIDDWQAMRDSASFLRVRTFVLWVMLFFEFIAVALVYAYTPQHAAYYLNAVYALYSVGALVSFAVGCATLSRLIGSATVVNEIQSFLDDGQGFPLSMENACMVSITFDLIFFFAALAIWCLSTPRRVLVSRGPGNSVFTADDRRALIAFGAKTYMPVAVNHTMV